MVRLFSASSRSHLRRPRLTLRTASSSEPHISPYAGEYDSSPCLFPLPEGYGWTLSSAGRICPATPWTRERNAEGTIPHVSGPSTRPGRTCTFRSSRSRWPSIGFAMFDQTHSVSSTLPPSRIPRRRPSHPRYCRPQARLASSVCCPSSSASVLVPHRRTDDEQSALHCPS